MIKLPTDMLVASFFIIINLQTIAGYPAMGEWCSWSTHETLTLAPQVRGLVPLLLKKIIYY